MTNSSPSRWSRILNIGLRLASLGTKLALTLYITRYLNLSAMGNYGLVTGAVFILMVVLGMSLDYSVSRELVGATPFEALTIIRNQAVFYALNQVVLAIAILALFVLGVTGVSGKILLVIFVLSVLENYGDTTFQNFISLGKPLVANVLFFFRTAFWAIPVIGLGLWMPEFRSIKLVFVLWAMGSGGSLLVALYLWRDLPWRKVLKTPIDWKWIKKNVKHCFLLWLGALGTTATYYNDRFVLASNMSLELVGVATFYSSFSNSLIALIHSGVLSFSYPKLIAQHRENDKTAFYHEARKLVWNVALLAGALGIAVGIVVPIIGRFLSRPEIVNQEWTLWLIIFATWLRCNSETLFYIMFSRHQDTALWLGGLLSLIPSFGCNLVLVPLIGFSGIGYSAILAALFTLLWRARHVYKNTGTSFIDASESLPNP